MIAGQGVDSDLRQMQSEFVAGNTPADHAQPTRFQVTDKFCGILHIGTQTYARRPEPAQQRFGFVGCRQMSEMFDQVDQQQTGQFREEIRRGVQQFRIEGTDPEAFAFRQTAEEVLYGCV